MHPPAIFPRFWAQSTGEARAFAGEEAMGELDFTGKTALVVGGSSGIGNGIAQAFRARGAAVHVWGTRARAGDYAPADGSDLAGLHYARLDVADFAAIDDYAPPFSR